MIGLEEADLQLIPQFVSLAHQNVCYLPPFSLFQPFLTQGVSQNVKPMLSIGGWSGSKYFSSSVATEENRTDFATAIANVVSQYNFAGVEFECALF